MLIQLFDSLAHTINGNVAQGSGAVVLNVRIWRVQEADQDRDRSGVNELLTILI